ncbi:MAG: DUF547 domain-containing protein [Vicingaceae bacterium]
MKKRNVIITLSTLFFACGSSAENNIYKTVKAIENKQEIISEKTVIKVEEEIKSSEIKKEAVVVEAVKKTLPIEKTEEKVIKKTETIIADELPVEETKVIKELVFKINHTSWNNLLEKNVGATGKVNYKGMKSDLPQIKEYLNYLNTNSPKKEWTKNEKLAYWINLYNASTVYLISSNYPLKSITNLSGGKPWDKKFVKSGDKVYTLNQIENDIVRPRFKDPRIHAALNCAAVSCPNLLNEAFVATKLNSQLDKQCKVWVNDVTKNKLEDTKVKVSQIFDWYAADFKAGGGVVAFINKYAAKKVSPKAKKSFLEYNWGLNE